jgi:hypothetical protein
MEFGVLLVVAQDGATAVCAGFNSAYFSLLGLQGDGPRARRVAAAALAVLNAAIVVESLFAQALFWAHRSGASLDTLLSPGPWLAARFLLFLAAALITFLILRRAR